MMKSIAVHLSKIVNKLNDGAYHDGTTLGDSLGISRNAVWKIIKKLEGYGIEIDSIKGKGYAMKEPLILLNANSIKKSINHNNVTLEVFETIDSTNTYLQAYCSERKIRVCIAEQQEAGKGRLQRSWYSPFGKNIYCSLLYPFQQDVGQLAGLSLITSLAIKETLQHYAKDNELLVKWPNDVIYQHKKLAGNVIEIFAESNDICCAIIGIGINVNMRKASQQQIDQDWTSLINITGNHTDRNKLCADLMNNLLDYLNIFNDKGLEPFMAEWQLADSLMNKKITLQGINDKVTGIVKGINNKGHLLLKTENDDTKDFSAGDVTIAK